MDYTKTTWKQIEGMDFLPASDALWRHTPMPLTARYNVYGVPLTVATNAPVLAGLAEEVFGHWGGPSDDAQATDLSLRIFLHDVPEKPPFERPILRAQENNFWVLLGGSFGFADRSAGFATAFVTPAMATDRDLLKSCFLGCLGVYLAWGRRKATLHAAGLLYGEQGVLLTGPDGAGKSTLAYACLRAGFRLLSEDIVVVQEAPEEHRFAWGDSRFLHLLSDAPRFFPELKGAPFVQQLNGETKLRIRVDAVRPDAGVTRMPISGVCSLRRGGGGASRLLAADPDYLRHALTHFKGDPPIDQAAMHSAVDRLLTGRTAHLEVGDDPDEAVAVVRKWMDG